ncbi:hypothetical protein ABEB36_013721 [Hypothenemus hampei]|uniref:BESS domain-containing protein n=1 Tax=Hypothenemus hampei TaxID=57062 RepID=A0ABD1E525_HYPHA
MPMYEIALNKKKIKNGDAAKHIEKIKTNLDVDEANRAEQSNELAYLSESDADADIEISFNKETESKQNFTRNKRKKNDTLDNKLIAFLDETTKSDQDNHKAFLTSLLPTLKTFNEVQTLQFRSKHFIRHNLYKKKMFLPVYNNLMKPIPNLGNQEHQVRLVATQIRHQNILSATSSCNN